MLFIGLLVLFVCLIGINAVFPNDSEVTHSSCGYSEVTDIFDNRTITLDPIPSGRTILLNVTKPLNFPAALVTVTLRGLCINDEFSFVGLFKGKLGECPPMVTRQFRWCDEDQERKWRISLGEDQEFLIWFDIYSKNVLNKAVIGIEMSEIKRGIDGEGLQIFTDQTGVLSFKPRWQNQTPWGAILAFNGGGTLHLFSNDSPSTNLASILSVQTGSCDGSLGIEVAPTKESDSSTWTLAVEKEQPCVRVAWRPPGGWANISGITLNYAFEPSSDGFAMYFRSQTGRNSGTIFSLGSPEPNAMLEVYALHFRKVGTVKFWPRELKLASDNDALFIFNNTCSPDPMNATSVIISLTLSSFLSGEPLSFRVNHPRRNCLVVKLVRTEVEPWSTFELEYQFQPDAKWNITPVIIAGCLGGIFCLGIISAILLKIIPKIKKYRENHQVNKVISSSIASAQSGGGNSGENVPADHSHTDGLSSTTDYERNGGEAVQSPLLSPESIPQWKMDPTSSRISSLSSTAIGTTSPITP